LPNSAKETTVFAEDPPDICLITFALIAPNTLPAGGIQKRLNQNKFPHNTNEIILSSNISLYSCPKIHAKELLVLE